MSDSAAPGLGVVLGAAGPCPEFASGGKKWVVGHPTQAAKVRLEKLVAKVALDEVRRLKDALDPDAYREAFSEAVRGLKDFRTWGPGWQRVVGSPANAHLFLWSLLQEHHPDVTEEAVVALCRESPEEVQAALAQVMPDFFRTLLAEVADRLTPEGRERAAAALAAVAAQFGRTPAPASTPNS